MKPVKATQPFTGFHGIVTPGTLRDSLFILSGLLDQQTRLDPREIMSDTHGSSDVVFGLFALLGYRFSPQLADLADQRFWRIDPHADYGALNDLSRHRVNTRLIAEHWDDLLRLAGSLKLSKVKATSVMRTLQRGGSLSRLGRAAAELGRIEKTLYLLAYVHDESYRRRILVQLNRGEGRHSVARAVFHGRKGELRQNGVNPPDRFTVTFDDRLRNPTSNGVWKTKHWQPSFWQSFLDFGWMGCRSQRPSPL